MGCFCSQEQKRHASSIMKDVGAGGILSPSMLEKHDDNLVATQYSTPFKFEDPQPQIKRSHILVLGESKTGKTALLKRIESDTFTSEYFQTQCKLYILK